VALHVLWGFLLLVDAEALGATSLHAVSRLPRLLVASMLFAVAALAVVSVTRRRSSWVSLALVLPQQAVLSISAFSAIAAVVTSTYGDGVPRPWSFILADQAPVILTLVLHTIAVVQLHTSHRVDALHSAVDAMQSEADRLRDTVADPDHGSKATAHDREAGL
jgi:hypothetical protein